MREVLRESTWLLDLSRLNILKMGMTMPKSAPDDARHDGNDDETDGDAWTGAGEDGVESEERMTPEIEVSLTPMPCLCVFVASSLQERFLL